MIGMNGTHVGADALRKLYADDMFARILLDHAASRKNNVKITTVDRMLSRLVGEQNEPVSRQNLIDTFRKLEAIGYGRFIVGRHGQQSRFEWSVQLTSVGKVARCEEMDTGR